MTAAVLRLLLAALTVALIVLSVNALARNTFGHTTDQLTCSQCEETP